MFLQTCFATLVLLGQTSVTLRDAPPPTVQLDNATFVGVSNGTVSKFLGIPFAQPPIGDLRFRLPVPVGPYNGTQQATAFGLSCSQQNATGVIPPNLPQAALAVLSGFAAIIGGEDCLTINVIVPATATPQSKLPVAVWIYGGAWEFGGTESYDGGPVVNRSIVLDDPIIYVSMNYRLNGFGFLASKEVQEAGVGNIGLHDQREALRWIQKYIGAFGGDPTKVTIWGESAGAISASYHMVANNGNAEGLFRGAFMQSGSPFSVGPLTDGQVYYDTIVAQTNCSGASDTLDCLRTVPYNSLKAAIDATPSAQSFQSLVLAWLPRVDGSFITENPRNLVKRGVIANVPFVTGNCDDEGTIFALSSTNITTDSQFRAYVQDIWLPNASPRDLDRLLELYPNNVTAGSPFETGDSNAITPQFKRMAAFQGDAVFQAPRRFLLAHTSGKQNTWSFLSKRFKSLPVFGALHGSDIRNAYGGGELTDYLVRFATNLDPNGDTQPYWPKYTMRNKSLLTLLDGSTPVEISRDNYRKKPIAFVSKLNGFNPNGVAVKYSQ